MITSWEKIVPKLLDKFFSPERTACIRDKILWFCQSDNESIKDAWKRFQDLLHRAPHHRIKKWLLVQLFYDSMIPKDKEKLNQFTQFGFSSLNEEKGWDRIEELIHNQDDSWDKVFNSEPTLNDRLNRAHQQLSFLTTSTPGKTLKNPYLKKDDWREKFLSIFKHININLLFLEALNQMLKGDKACKDLLSNKAKLENVASSVTLSEECLAVIQKNLPQKKGDPGSFTLPCLIGTMPVKNALPDLGGSINLMPYSFLMKLGISELKPTKMSIRLADRSIKMTIASPYPFAGAWSSSSIVRLSTIGAVLGQRSEKHYLVLSKTIILTDHSALRYLFYKQDAKPRLIRWILLLQEFDIEIQDKKGAKNLATNHLSRHENHETKELIEDKIDDRFSDESIMKMNFGLEEPWFADFTNYLMVKELPNGMTIQEKKKFFSDLQEAKQILHHCNHRPVDGHHGANVTARNVFECGFYWPIIYKDAHEFVKACNACQRVRNVSTHNEMPQNSIQVCEVFDILGINFMVLFLTSYGNTHILVSIDYVSKWAEAQALPTIDARVVVKFLKRLFIRFGIPKALVSVRVGHFCNHQLEKALQRYGLTHTFSTAYHLQTSGQVENTNHALK
nr:reverse transcriptase domain-containing protein [Tanacetum cinerariifolium]